MQPDPLSGQHYGATEELATNQAAAKEYTPPSSLGAPERLQGGGAR